ncbi:MAG: tRNA lysidine(34) synthetase TilS [Anaerolineales bacterium]
MSDIASILANQCALAKDRPLIVGFSGGADSLCLLLTLREAGYPIIAAHFDHQLRAESPQDAQRAKQTCAALSIDCVGASQNVLAYAQEKKLSIEEAARELRYRFLFKLAREKNAQAVAVGHTADDQAETILMHILRGSALDGLRGMTYRATLPTFDANIPLVRPLLNMTRAETEACCAAHHLQPLRDASNDSLDYRRNQIRHQILPLLKTYNPQIQSALRRLSQTVQDDLEIIETLEDSLWQEAAAPQDGFVTLNLNLLAGSAAGLKRRLIRRAMQTLRPNLNADFAAFTRAEQALAAGFSKRIDLKDGLYFFCEGGSAYVCTKDAQLPLKMFPQIEAEQAIRPPRVVKLANGWTLRFAIEEHLRAEEIFANENPLEAWFDAGALAQPLRLRKPQPGDSLQPLGLNAHSQKLSNLFVNEKIPQRARGNWALLCLEDEILWVVGLRVSHLFRVTEKTKRALRVTAQP